MAKLTLTAASKVYDVSSPTLHKHLKNGKISGEKVTDKGWQIDTAELSRVYAVRPAPGQRAEPTTFAPVANDLQDALKAEIEELKRDLAVQTALADERQRLLDQSLKLLEAPKRRRFWSWG